MMVFSVSDFRDLMRVLEEHPDWRDELRRVLLADDLLALRAIVRELAEAERRTDARLEQLAEAERRTDARLEQLAEAEGRTDARLEQLAEAQGRTEARLEQLAEAQGRTEARLGQLAVRVDQLTQSTGRLVDTMVVVERDVGELKGLGLEQRYCTHAGAYFAPLLRRIRLVPVQELADLVDDAEERGLIMESDRLSVLATDVVVRGRRRDDRQEVYLAVEVSWVIDGQDVERAAERAAILARVTGQPGIAVVAGKSMSDRAVARARELGVREVLDGASTPG